MKQLIDVDFSMEVKSMDEVDVNPDANPILYKTGHFHFEFSEAGPGFPLGHGHRMGCPLTRSEDRIYTGDWRESALLASVGGVEQGVTFFDYAPSPRHRNNTLFEMKSLTKIPG